VPLRPQSLNGDFHATEIDVWANVACPSTPDVSAMLCSAITILNLTHFSPVGCGRASHARQCQSQPRAVLHRCRYLCPVERGQARSRAKASRRVLHRSAATYAACRRGHSKTRLQTKGLCDVVEGGWGILSVSNFRPIGSHLTYQPSP
jgi:hypothetical protein